MDPNSQTSVDTRDQAPASSPQVEKQDTSTAALWAEAKQDMAKADPVERKPAKPAESPAPEAATTDTATQDATDQRETPRFKYRSHEEAEKAYSELQRKLGEQGAELARLKQQPPQKPDTQAAPDRDHPPEKEPDGELELDDNELGQLWQEDPAAAARYLREQVAREADAKVKPLAEKLQKAEAEARETAEIAAFKQYGEKFDADHGNGAWQRTTDLLKNENSVADLLQGAEDETFELVKMLYHKGDRFKVTKVLAREAMRQESRRREAKTASSVPASTGRAAATERAQGPLTTTADQWAAAKRELSRKR